MAGKKGQGSVHTRMKSTESDHVYHTRKNKKNHPNRMELRKFDPTLNRHVLYREEK